MTDDWLDGQRSFTGGDATAIPGYLGRAAAVPIIVSI
jgi:hypothetical protein